MRMSRRRMLAGGAAAAGLGGMAVAARALDGLGLLPVDAGGIYGVGHTLTYAAQRALTGQSLAREFPPEKISQRPFANGTQMRGDAFEASKRAGFVDWRLEVDGLVDRPGVLSIEALKDYPSRRQITSLACEEGWSYVAEWIGAPLSHVLEHAGVRASAKYVVYESMEPYWKDAIDMADALHPQTVVAYGFNGGELPVEFGGPLRMRVPRQLGYKSVKFLKRIIVTDTLEGHIAPGAYSWYAGI